MSVLAIDIGNSRVGLNVFTQGKAAEPAVRITHAELDERLAETLRTLWERAERETHATDDLDTEVTIVSVVPALTQRVSEVVMDALSVDSHIIGRDIKVPLKTALTDDTTVGQDRLCAALAAFVNVENACAIVHMGTALVVDCVDAEGVFRGGAIAPELRMGEAALHEYAAQLPEVTPAAIPDDVPFGRETVEAINLGLHAAARGTVRELVERYATALGSWPHVAATGGDARAVLGDELVSSFVPDLVLQGAALAWERWLQGEEDNEGMRN